MTFWQFLTSCRLAESLCCNQFTVSSFSHMAVASCCTNMRHIFWISLCGIGTGWSWNPENSQDGGTILPFVFNGLHFSKLLKHSMQRSQFAYHTQCCCNLHVCCQTKNNVDTARFEPLRPLIVWLIQLGGGKDLQQREEKEREQRDIIGSKASRGGRHACSYSVWEYVLFLTVR